MMARDFDMKMLSVFANQCPANNTATSQGGRAVDGLNLGVIAERTFVVNDKISFVMGDSESTSGVEDNVDNVGIRTA